MYHYHSLSTCRKLKSRICIGNTARHFLDLRGFSRSNKKLFFNDLLNTVVLLVFNTHLHLVGGFKLFQKILVKMDHFPQCTAKAKHFFLTTATNRFRQFGLWTRLVRHIPALQKLLLSYSTLQDLLPTKKSNTSKSVHTKK